LVQDLLGSGLLSLSSAQERIFFNPKLPADLGRDEASLATSTTPLQQQLPETKQQSKSGSQGTRILPVYVLSLLGYHKQLLLDHDQLMAAYD
jgi:hypothetical protein